MNGLTCKLNGACARIIKKTFYLNYKFLKIVMKLLSFFFFKRVVHSITYFPLLKHPAADIKKLFHINRSKK